MYILSQFVFCRIVFSLPCLLLFYLFTKIFDKLRKDWVRMSIPLKPQCIYDLNYSLKTTYTLLYSLRGGGQQF